MTTRIFIIFAAMWLIVSAFAWPHTEAQMLNTAISGALLLVLSVLTLFYGSARYLCLAMAAWLFVSTLKMTTLTNGTLWNNGILAGAIFFAAMITGEPKEIRHEKELYGRT